MQLNNGNQNKVKRITMGQTGFAKGTQKSNGVGKTLLSSLKKSKFEEAVNEEIDPPTCLNIR